MEKNDKKLGNIERKNINISIFPEFLKSKTFIY